MTGSRDSFHDGIQGCFLSPDQKLFLITNDETEASLVAALDEFAEVFQPTAATGDHAGEAA